MKTFAIAGCGHLGTIIRNAYLGGFLKDYKLIAAYSRNEEDAKKLVMETGAEALSSMDDVIRHKPDYIIETASIALFKDFAIKALEEGISVIPLSIGAFADSAFKDEALKAAEKSDARIYIPSGAVGGFDAMLTISLMAKANGWPIKAGLYNHKGPAGLRNTPLYAEELKEEEKRVFYGTTAEAIAILPTKVNVAVATALSSIGADNATAEIVCSPDFTGDTQCAFAETEGNRVRADIYSATSDIAAWSVVALMRNLTSTMIFF